MFSSLVTSRWIPGAADDASDGGVMVRVDGTLPATRSVALVRVTDGPAVLSLSPARATDLELTHGEVVDAALVSARIEGAGIILNDPDHLFYLTLPARATLRAEVPATRTRQLTAADAGLFDDFTAHAPGDDLDEAFVALDHWLVFGTVVDDRLVCAASMYPWDGTRLADLGVITLPEFRGRGLGVATVRATSAAALRRGYEPQYRCQLDNAGSVALARAAGFTRFGEWEVILDVGVTGIEPVTARV